MIRNFLFHRVNPQRDKLWDPMSVDHFDRCIKFLVSKYTVVPFEEIALDKKALKTSNYYATIMFDDGYKDNIEYALPILEKYNVKASFYIVTNCIDKNIPTWTYQLDYAFQNTNRNIIRLNLDFLPQKFRSGNLYSEQERKDFVKAFKPFLKTLSFNERIEVLKQVHNQFDDVKQPRLMMDWADLRRLNNLGHYIGSHTVSHPMLGTMDNENQIRVELLESAKRIQQELGYFPLTISYPIGSTSEIVKKISEEVGYKIGLAVNQDVFNPQIDNIYEVPRIELYNENWFKTQLRISNRLETIKKIIGYR